LPAYRGAAPIQWSIIRGERETGITIMKLDEGMDTGPMLLSRREVIRDDDTAGSLAARLAEIGAEALVEALIAAPSITDRRVYYDALLRLNTGVRTLIHVLGDHRWYVVRNAIELLAEMCVTEAEAELTKLLKHRDDRVRAAAASALAKFGAASPARGVRASPGQSPAEVRERTAEALALSKRGSADSLIRAIDKEEDAQVQMAMLGTPQAVERLVDIASSDRGLRFKKRPTPLRVAAVHALGGVKSTSALAALQALLRDKEKAVRGAAAWVMLGRKREDGRQASVATHQELPEGSSDD
jgi:HEAT repeat protein